MLRTPGETETIPPWLWRMLGLAFGVVILGSLVLFGVLALGVADPPAGGLTWEQLALPGECLAVNALELPVLHVPAAIEARAVVETAPEALTTWGVWFGSVDDPYRWEVLPPGYYRYAGQTVPFFHVQTGANDLRLDIDAGRAQLWLNREFAFEASLEVLPVVDWGILGDAGVCWQRLAVYVLD